MSPLARPLSELIAASLPRDERFDAVVPVPLHWWRRWRRGFNQSELLAREISRRIGAPMVKGLLRARATSAQAGLTRGARRRNVQGAFRARRASKTLQGNSVLLIDDVMTTGSTAAACALVLKRAGAGRVTLLTVARVDRRGDALAGDFSGGGQRNQ